MGGRVLKHKVDMLSARLEVMKKHLSDAPQSEYHRQRVKELDNELYEAKRRYDSYLRRQSAIAHDSGEK